jgi:hypothetical protein
MNKLIGEFMLKNIFLSAFALATFGSWAATYKYTLSGLMSVDPVESSSFVHRDPFSLSFEVDHCDKEMPLAQQEVVQFYSAFPNALRNVTFRLSPGAAGAYGGAIASGPGQVLVADNKNDGQDTIDFRVSATAPGSVFDTVDGFAPDALNFQFVYYQNTFSLNKKNGRESDVLFGTLFNGRPIAAPDFVIFYVFYDGGSRNLSGFVTGVTSEIAPSSRPGRGCPANQ